MFNRN